jgi:hypothetical protein
MPTTINANPANVNAPAATPTVPITATANGSNHGAKLDLQASYQALIVGLETYYQPNDVFRLRSGSFTRDELIAQFQQFLTLAEATKNAQHAWRDAVQLEREFEVQVRPLRLGVRSVVTARFGKDGTQLMKFGFTQGKQGKKSAATKAAAVVKTRATRAAHGIKGKKQRKAIKVPVAPVAATGASGGTPAPAGAPVSPQAGTGAKPTSNGQ